MDGMEIARQRLRSSRSPVALTGAGVSAESGVPTFRGAEGLWKTFRPEDLATPEAFDRDPVLVWEWYGWRRSTIASIRPNAAHYALVELEKRNPAFTLITQNVDGLHSLAGSRSVIELHGSIWRTRCLGCGGSSEDRIAPIRMIPRCALCNGVLRPDVVWFGEMLPVRLLNRAFEASEGADVMIAAGTSGVVQPAASLPSIAKKAGAYLIEVNPEPTPLSGIMDARLTGKAGELLPKLL